MYMLDSYYCLNSEFAIRSYEDKPFCVVQKYHNKPTFIGKNAYELLLKCDGKTLIDDENKFLFEIKRFITKCQKDEYELDPWQKEIKYNNRFLPEMNIQLTGKCNYNCLHCFSAVDNAPLNTELSYEDMISILDQARDCGVLGFTITGGEPLIHKRFIDIMKEIYKRNMMVFDLNTNGFFITEELLDEMKSFHMEPVIKISFDGLGYHDWMRNHKGAEEKAIEAFKLCIKKGFKTFAQVNVNKVNYDSIKPTIDYLDSLGLDWIRLIATTEVPRWNENAPNKCLSLDEYFDFAVDIAKYCKEKQTNAEVIIWRVAYINSKNKKYCLVAIDEDSYKESRPLCVSAYEMMAVGADGNVYPCLQAQGTFDSTGIYLGNIKKQSLLELLTNSDYQKYMTMCIKDKIDYCKECRECEHLKKCGGGCPCLSIVTSNHRYKPDLVKCTFFKKGYDLKIIEALKGYRNETGSPYKCN